MSRSARQIVAFGGGGFSMEPRNPLLDRYVLEVTGVERPRVCFLPTASGDADHYIVKFYKAFAASSCIPSHITVFRRDFGVPDVRAHLLEQDLIYVGGGSIISLLGVWRGHGLDTMLRDAWEAGVVLCGLSAGSLCWFEQGLTSFHGSDEVVEGLGILPGSNAVHYDEEAQRRPAYHSELQTGRLLGGYAACDGAALHFVGTDLARVVTSRPESTAYRVDCVHGEIVETELETQYLGAPRVVADPSPEAALRLAA